MRRPRGSPTVVTVAPAKAALQRTQTRWESPPPLTPPLQPPAPNDQIGRGCRARSKRRAPSRGGRTGRGRHAGAGLAILGAVTLLPSSPSEARLRAQNARAVSFLFGNGSFFSLG